MARTRSKPAPKATEEPTPSATAARTLLPKVANPPKFFVLPKETSPDARIITLDNPANSNPGRYLFCPEKGFYEFTRIAAPKKTPRSWLIAPPQSDNKVEKTSGSSTDESNGSESQEKVKKAVESSETDLSTGYITKSSDLFIATPIDILFLILPSLSPKSAKSQQKDLFLSLEDHLDTLAATSPHLRHLLRGSTTTHASSLRTMIENRMTAFCDTVDAGDEKMYRLSVPKLVDALVKKAERMSKNGLPKSMEEKFIRPVLDIPVMSIKREESGLSIVSSATETPVLSDTPTESQSTTPGTEDSQISTGSVSTSATTTSIEPPKPALTTSPEVLHLLRLRTSLNYLLSSYIPPSMHGVIQTHLTTLSTPSFAPLDTHLQALQALRQEATSLRSLSDNISRKRGYDDDDEKAMEREEKKRKKEEEEKKKKLETRGVKQLKKVDTSGMRKLSSFFAKAGAKK